MNRTPFLWLVASSVALVGAGCGGGTRKVAKPVVVAPAPAKKKPVKKKKAPPPVCVRQSEQAVIGMSAADGDLVQYCVADGGGDPQCYAVELDKKKWEKLPSPPIPQAPSMTPPVARLQSTPAEVRVCPVEGGTCKALKPRIRAGANPLEAAINAQGTWAAVLIGDADAGKGVVQVWNVGKKKKTAAIKYAKGDYKCGTAHVLDDVVFISAGNCLGPAARGALYSNKGKKLADVGGKDFGTYGTVPVQIGEHRWAFLSENGTAIAIHDSTTGALEKTIDLASLWTGDDADAGGSPGESALLRGGDGKLLVVTGSPHAGSIGVVDVDGGSVEVVPALACTGDEPAARTDDDGDDDGSSDDRGDDGSSGDDDDDDDGARAKKPAADAGAAKKKRPAASADDESSDDDGAGSDGDDAQPATDLD